MSGLIVALSAGSIWKGERPYGELGDYGLSLLLAVLVGLIDWYLVADFCNFEGVLKFVVAVGEPPFVSLIGLWILRKISG